MVSASKPPDDADLIGGGDRIAEFLFRAADERLRREVYCHTIDIPIAYESLPSTRVICARLQSTSKPICSTAYRL